MPVVKWSTLSVLIFQPRTCFSFTPVRYILLSIIVSCWLLIFCPQLCACAVGHSWSQIFCIASAALHFALFLSRFQQFRIFLTVRDVFPGSLLWCGDCWAQFQLWPVSNSIFIAFGRFAVVSVMYRLFSYLPGDVIPIIPMLPLMPTLAGYTMRWLHFFFHHVDWSDIFVDCACQNNVIRMLFGYSMLLWPLIE